MITLGKTYPLLLSLLFFASHARADDALAQLERELDLHAQEGHTERIAQGIAASALGAVLLPAGIVLTHRDDNLVRLIGIGTTVAGAVQFTRLPGLFVPSDMERVRTRHLRRKASGLAPDALVREAEKDWQHEAAIDRVARKYVGAVHLAVGVAAIPVGLAFMLKDEVGSMSHAKQINIGSTFLGIGVPFIAVATTLLFDAGPTNRAWNVHERTRLGVAPIAHGGALMATGSF